MPEIIGASGNKKPLDIQRKRYDSNVNPEDHWDFLRTFPDYMGDYDHAKPPVPSTLPPLDKLLHGGFRAGVHFIGGTTGAGKTAFALYLMSRIASTKKP